MDSKQFDIESYLSPFFGMLMPINNLVRFVNVTNYYTLKPYFEICDKDCS